MPAQSDIEHLLRRTEFVARPGRVAELTPLSLEAAVDNILDVPSNPGSVTFTETSNWERGVELTHFWLDRMAHDSPRPIHMVKNNRGLWKAKNYGSLDMGIRPPVAEADDDL